MMGGLLATRPRLSAFWMTTLIQVSGWFAYGLSTFLSLLPHMPPHMRGIMLATKMSRAVIGMALSLVMLMLYRWLRSRRPGIAVTVIAAWATSAVFGVLWMRLFQLVLPASLRHPDVPRAEMTLPVLAADMESHLTAGSTVEMVFVLLAWSGMYHAIVHWRDLQERERQMHEAQRLAHHAQVAMLSYQINPHFLFNALNSIRAMIAENQRRAKDMVTQLAVFLRYTLTADATRHVTVAEEFEMIDGYLAIEAIRFEERLDAQTYVDPHVAGCRIPRFIVHPLVENAIKHGRAAGGQPLHLRVRAAPSAEGRVMISVRNTGALKPGRSSGAQGFGVGWKNIRHRLELLYGSDAHFTVVEQDGWVVVTIDMPAVMPAGSNATASGAIQHA
ncbi:MAG TPA: histidine kinase [Gemmatimonadaceae bacterium]|nr:histidine kinase [Gemmatimonadaceae bacterium]